MNGIRTNAGAAGKRTKRAPARGRSKAPAHVLAIAAGHRRGGRLEQAVAAYRRAVGLAPRDPRAHGGLGTALRDMRRFAEADACYRHALALDPLDPWTLNNAAVSARLQRRHDEALALVSQSAAIDPANHETFTLLAAVQLDRRDLERAKGACARALALRPEHAEALNLRGRIAYEEGRSEEAIVHYRAALALKPDLGGAHNNLGNALRELGEIDAARAAFIAALTAEPRLAIAYLNLADLHKFAPGDPYLAAMEELAADSAMLTESAQLRLAFALAKAYGDVGDHARAFRNLLLANGLKRRQIFYDEQATLAPFERIRAVFTDALMRRARSGEGAPVPVLIVGMPRSGTTLVEQILASHPRAFGAGELPDLATLTGELRDAAGAIYPECVAAMDLPALRRCGETYLAGLRRRAPDAACITDKLPANFAHVGFVHLAVPNARVIHVRRDPLDTCVSCFSKLFAEDQLHFAYDLGEIARYYRAYAALMDHWRAVLPPGAMLEVQYEELVAHPERQLRRLLAYCGLAWDDACLRFYETRRPVRTVSAGQVREPIFRRSVGRSQAYRPWLGPMVTALGMGEVPRVQRRPAADRPDRTRGDIA